MQSCSSKQIPDGLIWIVVPVLDEEENLRELLPRIPRRISGRGIVVLVVDDGCADGSAQVARDNRCEVISLPVNCGGGMALKAGFEVALAHRAEAVVTLDGDGQHDPDQIPDILAPVIADEADLVIGSRYLGGHERVSLLRSTGLHFFNWLINCLQGTCSTDCASGFRAIRGSLLGKLDLNQNQYHTAEMLIEASKQGARIDERPIQVKKRIHGESKKGFDLLYGFYFFRTVIKTWLR